jgi:hypothetical protein
VSDKMQEYNQTPTLVLTGDGVMAYHMLAQRAALKLEMKGLRHSSGRSVYAHIKRIYNLSGNKQRVLEQFENLLREKGYLRS